MEFYDTSICFVTAVSSLDSFIPSTLELLADSASLLQHFAAGHTNVAERNADYWTIASGLRFQKGKTIASHEFVLLLSSRSDLLRPSN